MSTVLLTGATGYVGGRLLQALEAGHRRVRCLTRQPEALTQRAGVDTEVVGGDLLDRESVARAMRGIDSAYYMVHSMGGGADFSELDRRAAVNFAHAARSAGLQRIVYLGGLGDGDDLSPHLTSRHEVGQILRASGVTTVELRASIVIGGGSASFETVRELIERLPAIPAPRWVETVAQPIAIEDVIEYLIGALSMETSGHTIVEIGGRDRVSYADLMREYAHQRQLRRWVIPTSAVTTRVSRWFLSLTMPRHGRIAAEMVDSLRNETVVTSPTAAQRFAIEPRGLSEAIQGVLASEDHDFAETSWSQALMPTVESRWGGTPVGHRLVSSRSVHLDAGADDAFVPIQRIGGRVGWYATNWFWPLRGLLDRARGGVGLRRGRRDPDELVVGDTVDFWRVERLEPGRRLLLAAEMKLPGRLWLQFEVDPDATGALVRQTTVFDPAGYLGLLYWYLLFPVHHRIFAAMLRGLRSAADPNPALSL